MRSAASYGLLAAWRRWRVMLLPATTTATGSLLVVLVLALLPAVRRQAAEFGDPGDLSRATVATSILVLLVGVLEVSIVATRSVMQRRVEIGLLSATGVAPGRVLVALLMEPVATAMTGSVVGSALGVLTSILLTTTHAGNVRTEAGPAAIGVLVAVGLSLAASAAASSLPVIRAVHRPPLASLIGTR